MTLKLLEPHFSLIKLSRDSTIPESIRGSSLLSVTYSQYEVSVLCESKYEPINVISDPGWRVLEYLSDVDSHETGTVAYISGLLAAAHISILVVTSYGAGYFAVQSHDLEGAKKVLLAEGIRLL